MPRVFEMDTASLPIGLVPGRYLEHFHRQDLVLDLVKDSEIADSDSETVC